MGKQKSERMKPQMKPTAVVFDLGKVLLHFDYGIAAEKFQKRCRIASSDIRAVIDQSPLLHGFETGRLSGEEFFEELCRATGFAGDLDTGLTGGTVTSIVLRVGISTDKLPLPYYLPRSR